ncbi:MAG: hypothetical protein Q9221_002693 [Calogaya cf. arnoldii]
MFSSYLRLLPFLSLVSETLAATDCFTQVGDTYTQTAESNHRVSVSIECTRMSADFTCSVQSGGYVTEKATVNITTKSEAKLYDAIRHATGNPFYQSVTGTVGTFIYTVGSGQQGYSAFTSYLRCYEGTLGDYIGRDVQVGTPIQACTPTILNGKISIGWPVLNG